MVALMACARQAIPATRAAQGSRDAGVAHVRRKVCETYHEPLTRP
jgi:hypothetical protein